ncbi:MAG: hypothetical protein GX418_04935 [Clostridiales bacterium]|nr:hypothetical protein [Clostridiales bacterium]
MKRKLLVATLLLLFTLLVGGAALAATDPIVCSMEVSPDTLSEPGDVTVTITVSNSGDTDMKDPLTLYSPTSEIVKDFGDQGSVTLKAGEVKTWTGTWSVNQRTLDNGQIVYFVKYFLYKDNGEKEAQSQPIRGKINATEARTEIEIRRTISPGTAREGQTVTVKYDIVNTGTVSLKDITITENKDISSKAVSVTAELKAGETAQVKFPVTMGKKDLTSSATITYTTGTSKEKQTKTVAEQKITYGEAALSAKLTASSKGVAINGTVTLSLELKNSGSVNYTDVRVTDATLGDVFTNQEIAAGATLKLDKEITLTATTDYQFTITAIDNTGTEVSLSTDSLTLTAVDPSKMVHLNVTLGSDRTEVYTQPGIVRFSVTVENDSEVDAANVALYHGSTLVYTFPAIPAGETRSLTRDAALSMAGKYQFTAVVVDAIGNSNKFDSNEVQIAFSVPTPAPATPTPPLVPTPEPTYAALTVPPISDPSVGATAKLIRTFFYPLMIFGIVLLGAALALLVIATKKRMEQKKASDAALDHLDRAKRRDYVTPGEEDEWEHAPMPAAQPEMKDRPATASVAEDRARHDAEVTDVELPHMKYVRNAYQRNAQPAKPGYGAKGIYDEDPLTEPADYRGASGADSDIYHTYGDERELFAKPAPETPEAASTWSPFARRSEEDDYARPAEAFRGLAKDAAYPDGEPAAEGEAYDDYAGYDDAAADVYAAEDDGHVSDPMGYDAGDYADSQAAYPPDDGYDAAYEPSASYGADEPYGAADAGLAGEADPRAGEPGRSGGGRRSRRGGEEPNRGY